MPKHNNAIPRNHFRKHWNPESSQKGHIKTFFQQAKQKKARRVKRQQKAKSIFPRPAGGCLRPVVRACSARYNMKQRAGKGFTLAELKAAGLTAKYARTIGVAVDHRRFNHSEEALELNTLRLKDYLSKLVLYPLQGGAKARGPVKQASSDALKTVTQDMSATPLGNGKTEFKGEQPRDLTAEDKSKKVFSYLRKKNLDTKLIGARLAKEKRKTEKANDDGTSVKAKKK